MSDSTPAIRIFRKADIPAAIALWSTTDGLGHGPGTSAEGVARFLERNPGLSWVAVAGDAVVGAILCGDDGRRGQIYRLAVALEHRRQGLAAALVTKSLDALRDTGIERCLLSVLTDNAAADRFWTAVGARRRSELGLYSIDIEGARRGGALTLAAPRLETERLILRMFREEDFEAFARITTDPEVQRHLGNGKPLDRNDAWRNFAAQIGHWALRGYGLFAVEEKATGAFVGRIGFFNPEDWPGFELGWLLARETWGKGFATEAATRCLDFAFTELGQEHVISVIRPENQASIRVAERIGERFERDADVFGTRVHIYGIDRETWRARLRPV